MTPSNALDDQATDAARPIDLRSDTVTQPTDAMRAAMMAAPLGDDVLGDEPTVTLLEETIARRLGKEAALFVPSGTMANQIAIRCHCQPGDEIIAHRDSHIIHYETGAPAAITGCMIAPLDGDRGLFDAADVRAAVRPDNVHAPNSRLLVVENTHNRGGGSVWSIDRFASVAKEARAHGLAVHVDGARLFNAAVAGGYDPAEFVAHADTVSVCFSKALGAPVGSALLGDAATITRARRFRKMLGGGMRQSGLLAAAALHALDHHVDRLRDDHRRARRLAEGLASLDGVRLDPPLEAIETNMVFLSLDPDQPDAAAVCDRVEAAGVRLIAMGPRRVRAVVHLHVDDAMIDRTIELVHDALADHAPATTRGGRPSHQPRAAIVDLDGTLVETFDAHRRAWDRLLADEGIPYDLDGFRRDFGRRNPDIIRDLWRANGRTAPEGAALDALCEQKETLFLAEVSGRVDVMPGAAALLDALRADGWHVVAASSAPRTNCDVFIDAIGSARFDAVVTGDDVREGKPDPEVFLAAAARVGADPSRCVVLEDAGAGIEGAHRAGMGCVALLSTGRTHEELAAADVLVDRLDACDPHVFASLIGRVAAPTR